MAGRTPPQYRLAVIAGTGLSSVPSGRRTWKPSSRTSVRLLARTWTSPRSITHGAPPAFVPATVGVSRRECWP